MIGPGDDHDTPERDLHGARCFEGWDVFGIPLPMRVVSQDPAIIKDPRNDGLMGL